MPGLHRGSDSTLNYNDIQECALFPLFLEESMNTNYFSSYKEVSGCLDDKTNSSIGKILNSTRYESDAWPLKQFPCNRCGRNYKYKDSLRNHLKMECGIEPKFPCPFCPYRAKLKGNLKRHIKMRHS